MPSFPRVPGSLGLSGGSMTIFPEQCRGVLRASPSLSDVIVVARPIVRSKRQFQVAGSCVDASNNPITGAVVNLYRSGDGSFVGSAVTDGSGNFVIAVSEAGAFTITGYKTGGTFDKTGSTVNTVIATQV